MSIRVGFCFFKAGRRILCPEMPGLRELGGLARWRIETSRRIFYQTAPPGASVQISNPTNSGPAWSAGGA